MFTTTVIPVKFVKEVMHEREVQHFCFKQSQGEIFVLCLYQCATFKAECGVEEVFILPLCSTLGIRTQTSKALELL